MPRQNTLRLLWAVSGATILCSATPKFLAASPDEQNPAQLMSQLNALQSRVLQLERGNNPRYGYSSGAPSTDLAAQVVALSQQMATLTNVIKVNPTGIMIAPRPRIWSRFR